MIRGIDPDEEEKVMPLRKFINRGKLDLEGDSTVLGVELARKLEIDVGDKLTVYSPGNLGAIIDGLKKLENRKRRGGEGGDRSIARRRAAEGADGHRHFRDRSLPARLRVPARADLYRSGTLRISATRSTASRSRRSIHTRRKGETGDQKFLKPPEYAQTWIDMNNQYFEAVRLERTVMFFLLFFIVVVAAFGIMNTLITVTVQKTREIGIMKAIGANIWQIVWRVSRPGDRRRIIRHAHRVSASG